MKARVGLVKVVLKLTPAELQWLVKAATDNQNDYDRQVLANELLKAIAEAAKK